MTDKEETFEDIYKDLNTYLDFLENNGDFAKQWSKNIKQLHDKGIQRNTLEIAKKFEKEEYIKETNKLLESADRGFKIIMEEKDKEILKLKLDIADERYNLKEKDKEIKTLTQRNNKLIFDEEYYRNKISELQAENEKLKNITLTKRDKIRCTCGCNRYFDDIKKFENHQYTRK